MTQKHPLLTPNDSARSVVTQSILHDESMLDWRKSEFIRLGFSEHYANVLAMTRVDTHAMEKLLQRGCTHELARRILIGTMWNGVDPYWIDSDDGGYMDVPSPKIITDRHSEEEDDGA